MGLMKSRFIYTTLAIVVVLLALPYIRHLGVVGWLAGSLLVALIPLASLYAFASERRSVVVIAALGLPFLALDALSLWAPGPALTMLTYAFGTLLYAYIIFALLRDLLARHTVTADMIYCAVSIYLLIGMMWSGIYILLEAAQPGSFEGLSAAADIVYFSFVALTTVGFGDIAPVTVLARRLAVLEAAMGSIYMAIIVALIVGRYLSYETGGGGDRKP
jgi:hypothetical protein